MIDLLSLSSVIQTPTVLCHSLVWLAPRSVVFGVFLET